MKTLLTKVLFSQWIVLTLTMSMQENSKDDSGMRDKISRLLLAAVTRLDTLKGASNVNDNSNELWEAVNLFKLTPMVRQAYLSRQLVQRVFEEVWGPSCRCKVGALMQFLTLTKSASGFQELWNQFHAHKVFDESPYVVFAINSYVRNLYNCCFHDLPPEEQDTLYQLLSDVAAKRTLVSDELVHELVHRTEKPFTNKTLLIASQLSLEATALRRIVQQVAPALQSGDVTVTRVAELILRNEATFCQSARAIQEAISQQSSGCQVLRMHVTVLDGLPYVREYTSTEHFKEYCVPLANAVRAAYQTTRSTTPNEVLGACLRNAWTEMLRLSLNDETKPESPATRVWNGARVSGADQTDDLRNLFHSLNLGPCEDQAIQAQVTREVGLENTAGTLVRVVSLKGILSREDSSWPADREICKRLLSELPGWAIRLSRGGDCQMKNRHTGRELQLRLTFNDVGAAKLANKDGLYAELETNGGQVNLSYQPESTNRNQEWYLEPVTNLTAAEDFIEVFIKADSSQINLVDDNIDCSVQDCSPNILRNLRQWAIACNV